MEPPSRQPEVHDLGFAGRPIQVGGTILGAHRHICAFFHSHDDEYRVLLPFIKDGFENGEKAVHIFVGGILQENPFFAPPQEFIGELRERRARNAGPVSST